MNELQFDWTQEQELEAARIQGLDVSIMQNPEYLAGQMREIRLGLEKGLDVSLYAKPEFDWFQMEQIRLGLEEKADITRYADPSYNYETMKQIRLAWRSFVNLEPYLKRGFTGKELEEIRLCLEKEFPVDNWLTDDMWAQQICQIRLGMEEGIDVSVYAKKEYTWLQMQEIRLGIEKRLDVSCYANPLFSYRQMYEIRSGLEEGLDVSSYAKLVFSKTDMKKMRQQLLEERDNAPLPAPVEMNYIKQEEIVKQDELVKQKEINIFIEDNGNKVYAVIPWISGNSVTEADIHDELAKRGIVHGVNSDAISDMVQRKRMNEKVLVAEGTLPVDGKDGWYEFFVRIDLPRIPAPLPDGGVDYVNIEAFEMVDEGQKIAVYHAAEKGKDGSNVFGEAVHARNGLEKPTMKGEGFILDADGITYRARISGKFEFLHGRIIITNVLIVREDVTGVYGKIEVDGSVYVVGSVHSGGCIKATGDIIVEYNVEAAKLTAGGNIMIKRGSCSKHDCWIEAEGEVSGSFFESADIKATGDVRANYIMNSEIKTMGRVIVSGSKGMILGGRICAVKGVDTYNLGNSSHIKTVLEVGRNGEFAQKEKKLNEKKEKILNEIAIFEEGRKKMTRVLSVNRAHAEDYLKKIDIAMSMKEHELKVLDAEMTKLTNLSGSEMKVPIWVRGKAFTGSIVYIDNIKYVLPQEISRIILKKRNRNVVMLRL